MTESETFVMVLTVACVVYLLSSCETFVSTRDAFGPDAQASLLEKYKAYTFARDNPMSLMRADDGKPIVTEMHEDEKVDCNACSWKLDSFCATTDANGKIQHDARCNDMAYTDQFGMTHKSKGFMCSAYGTDLGFEECNSRKCKSGTMTGCAVSKLPELTKNITLTEDDISGSLEGFQGCPKTDGVFTPLYTMTATGDTTDFVFAVKST